jgi:hypothetical protein
MILVCPAGKTGGKAGEAPAATAAAAIAIASGAVALPVADGTAGESVSAIATGIVTATAAGVAAGAPPCGAEVPGSAEDAFSEDGFSVCCALLSLDWPDLVGSRWTTAVLVPASPASLEPEACPAFDWLLSDAFVALWPAEASSERSFAVPRDRVSPPLAATSSARRCDADIGCAAELVPAPVSAGRLESSSAPKLSFCGDPSARAGFGCAAWKDALADASDVTLTTVDCLSE